MENAKNLEQKSCADEILDRIFNTLDNPEKKSSQLPSAINFNEHRDEKPTTSRIYYKAKDAYGDRNKLFSQFEIPRDPNYSPIPMVNKYFFNLYQFVLISNQNFSLVMLVI